MRRLRVVHTRRSRLVQYSPVNDKRITEYYIETRYPLGVHTLLDPTTISADLNTARDLIALIRYKLMPSASHA